MCLPLGLEFVRVLAPSSLSLGWCPHPFRCVFHVEVGAPVGVREGVGRELEKGRRKVEAALRNGVPLSLPLSRCMLLAWGPCPGEGGGGGRVEGWS